MGVRLLVYWLHAFMELHLCSRLCFIEKKSRQESGGWGGAKGPGAVPTLQPGLHPTRLTLPTPACHHSGSGDFEMESAPLLLGTLTDIVSHCSTESSAWWVSPIAATFKWTHSISFIDYYEHISLYQKLYGKQAIMNSIGKCKLECVIEACLRGEKVI